MTVNYTSSHLFLQTKLERISWKEVLLWIYGEEAQLTIAPKHNGMDASELQALPITWTQLDQLDWELLKVLVLNMVELRLLLSCQREIGFGLLFGCYQKIRHTDNGQLVEKSILSNLEEM